MNKLIYANYFIDLRTNKLYIVSRHKKISNAIKYKRLGGGALEDKFAAKIGKDLVFLKTDLLVDLKEKQYKIERLSL